MISSRPDADDADRVDVTMTEGEPPIKVMFGAQQAAARRSGSLLVTAEQRTGAHRAVGFRGAWSSA